MDKKVTGITQNSLTYTLNPFDVERYKRSRLKLWLPIQIVKTSRVRAPDC